MTIAIAAVAPEVASPPVIHLAATAEREWTAAYRTNRFCRRRGIGRDLLAVGCLRYFHGSPE